jgi:hypothetical protein
MFSLQRSQSYGVNAANRRLLMGLLDSRVHELIHQPDDRCFLPLHPLLRYAFSSPDSSTGEVLTERNKKFELRKVLEVPGFSGR